MPEFDLDLGEESEFCWLEPRRLQLAHNDAGALDMRSGLLGAPELQKDLNAALMSDQLGPLLADGDGEGDRLLTGGERVPQVEFLELRDGVHRPVRDFNSAEPDTTALFDTTPEVAPGGRQGAPRILGVAQSAERSGLRLGVSRTLGQVQGSLMLDQAIVDPSQREERFPREMAARLNVDPAAVLRQRLSRRDILQRRRQLVEDPARRGAAQNARLRVRASSALRASW